MLDYRASFKKMGYAGQFANLTEQNWLEYLRIIRNLAKTNNKTAREVEKGLFAYNRIQLDKESKNLYKQINNKS